MAAWCTAPGVARVREGRQGRAGRPVTGDPGRGATAFGRTRRSARDARGEVLAHLGRRPYSLGGAAPASLSTVAGYLFGTHVLIGIGEGVITALTVVAVARTRPDLVFLLRGTRQEVAA